MPGTISTPNQKHIPHILYTHRNEYTSEKNILSTKICVGSSYILP